jgi:hypothetical protein
MERPKILASNLLWQEMGKIYFEVMKDDMFVDANARLDTFDSDVDEPDPDLFYRSRFYETVSAEFTKVDLESFDYKLVNFEFCGSE